MEIKIEYNNKDIEIESSKSEQLIANNYEELMNLPRINGQTLIGDIEIKSQGKADEIFFDDGDTFQEKYNNGELTGPEGPAGKDGTNGLDGINGTDGTDGVDGKSAYEIWIEAGNLGTESDFLNSLKGEQGIPGRNGIDGKDGENGINGIDGVNGTNGRDGRNGLDGKSAYDIWIDSGNVGDYQTFLNSLKGPQGPTGEPFTYSDFTPEQLAKLVGPQGPQGIPGQKGEDADLENYYDKQEIDSMIGNIESLLREV